MMSVLKMAGHSESTIRRVPRSHGVLTEKIHGNDGRFVCWEWSMPPVPWKGESADDV